MWTRKKRAKDYQRPNDGGSMQQVQKMNNLSRNHRTAGPNVCVLCECVRVWRFRNRSSPMLGCFSKRQILASLSSFWWSKRETEATWTQRNRRAGYSECDDRLSESSDMNWAALFSWHLHHRMRVLCTCAGCVSSAQLFLSDPLS